MQLDKLFLFDRLASSERVLLAGAGGGYDIYCGLPLYFALTRQGKQVFLANLSFAALDANTGPWPTPSLVEVTAASPSPSGYFPERTLCEWFRDRGEPVTVYAFAKTGARPLVEAYRHLQQTLALDAIVLVDGGTDSLMRGDESGVGTPSEDMVSLAAVASLDVPTRLLTCLGFGIDAFHGVCHAHVLEAVAALSRDGGYLGAFSVMDGCAEAQAYRSAVDYSFARTPGRESIVNASIVSALTGDYGDVHRTERTRGSELWINPLMTLYWSFDVDAVARRCLYLDHVRETDTIFEAVAMIEGLRKGWARDGRIRDPARIPV